MVFEMIMESVFAVVDIWYVSKLGADGVGETGSPRWRSGLRNGSQSQPAGVSFELTELLRVCWAKSCKDNNEDIILFFYAKIIHTTKI